MKPKRFLASTINVCTVKSTIEKSLGVRMSDLIEFRFPDKRYEEYSWVLQDEHNPASHPPLIASASPMARPSEEQDPDAPPATLSINGFNYAREVNIGGGLPNAFQTSPPESIADMIRWREEWLPEVDKLVQLLECFQPDDVESGKWLETLQSHDEEYRRVFSGIHRTAVGPGRLATNKFLEEWIKLYGEEGKEDAMTLLQGFPNRSLDRASALWDLSRIMRTDDSLRNLENIEKHTFNTPSSKVFRKSFYSMLDQFGCTSNNGLQDLPTWRDGSQIPISMIRSYSNQDDSKSPAYASERQKERRLTMESDLRQKAEKDPKIADLIHFMEMAQHLMPNLEDHNLLCDQQCVASSRRRWLNIGSHLKTKAVFSMDNEVFFYRRDELIDVLEGGNPLTKEEMSMRKSAQDRFRATPPPLYLGKKPENAENNLNIPVEGSTLKLIKGMAASPGTYRGVARVFQSIDDAGSLKEGEVLVVRALTPPWTPYVGIAGGIVTNSGGPLSHGAVVAREFGVPAIVGTVNGTEFIKDGMSIVVDGSNGVVVIE